MTTAIPFDHLLDGTQTLRVRNAPGAMAYNGREFTARIVRKGDRYGRDFCLTHDDDEPMVEFYDATYADDERFDRGLGQFVSRYQADTFMNHGATGCRLDCGIDVWTIDNQAGSHVYYWLKGALNR